MVFTYLQLRCLAARVMCNVIPRTQVRSFESRGEKSEDSASRLRETRRPFPPHATDNETSSPREKQPSAIQLEQRWNQQRDGATGEGIFVSPLAKLAAKLVARESGKETRNEQLDERCRASVFPTAPASAISRGTRRKSGAQIRITRRTTAQLKLRSRDQRKRNARPTKNQTRISCLVPCLPLNHPPPAGGGCFWGRGGGGVVRVEKFLAERALPSLLFTARERVTRHRWTASLSRVPPSPSARYLFPNTPSKHARTLPPNHTFSKHDRVHIHGEVPYTR